MIFIRSIILLVVGSVLTTCSQSKIKTPEPQIIFFPDFNDMITSMSKNSEIVYNLPPLESKDGNYYRDN